MPRRNALARSVSMPTKKCEQKRKAVVINEDTVHAAVNNGNGRPRIGQYRRKSESANAKPRTKRVKEPGRKKGARVEETTKVARIDKRKHVRNG